MDEMSKNRCKSDLSIASDLMSTRNVRKLPVIDDDKVVGILAQAIWPNIL
jgi:predicted transcriptional regulator